jgi:hypothetical protein
VRDGGHLPRTKLPEVRMVTRWALGQAHSVLLIPGSRDTEKEMARAGTESVNALTIGAQHHDHVSSRPRSHIAVDPFDDHELPNPSSAFGLGFRRTIKPEIYLPGGREHLRMLSSGGHIEAGFSSPLRLFGLSAAAPDTSGQ